MLTRNLGYKTIHELVDTMNDMMLDPNDIMADCMKNSAIWEPEVHAFRECYLENIHSLRELDMLPTGYLGGIPFAHKDNIAVKGLGTYCCSKILDGYISPYDANATERLIAAGGMIAGRANMDEFAMGSSTEYSAYGPTKNPWDLSKVPGGSSGGSAAAVASGQAVFATGSDTGGSVRLPASFCNLVGLRPTYGRVSRFGLVAFASSLDQIGPITRDVRDCVIVFSIIAGHDERDSTSIPEPMDDPLFTLENGVGEMRVGFLDDDLGDAVDPQIRAKMDEWKSFFESNAASLKPVKLSTLKYLLSSYYIIAPSEASSNLARYDGIRYGPTVESDDLIELFTKNREIGFGPEVKRRIMIGTFALSTGYYDAYYLKAQKLRALIRQELEEAFKEVDVIISPSSPVLPFSIGERVDDPLQMYATDVFQLPQALAGTPAVSIPGGFSKEGLPAGLQIWGKSLGESTILQAARAFEREHDFVKRVPEPPGGEA